jgi:hypothetical protein
MVERQHGSSTFKLVEEKPPVERRASVEQALLDKSPIPAMQASVGDLGQPQVLTRASSLRVHVDDDMPERPDRGGEGSVGGETRIALPSAGLVPSPSVGSIIGERLKGDVSDMPQFRGCSRCLVVTLSEVEMCGCRGSRMQECVAPHRHTCTTHQTPARSLLSTQP